MVMASIFHLASFVRLYPAVNIAQDFSDEYLGVKIWIVEMDVSTNPFKSTFTFACPDAFAVIMYCTYESVLL